MNPSQSILETAEVPVNPSVSILETAEVPVNLCTRNNSEISDDASNLMMSTTNDLPPAISPITSPIKSHSKLSNKEEILFLFCAKDQATASKLAKAYIAADPSSKYVGPHPNNKKHHFFFSTFIDSEDISILTKEIDRIGNKDFLSIRVVSEKKNYHP